LPLLEGLEFKNENIRQSIEENMAAEDEVKTNEFLTLEVEPLFTHLQKTSSEVQRITDDYFKLINQMDCRIY